MRPAPYLILCSILLSAPATLAGPVETEPNDDCHDAMEIEMGETVSAALDAPGDRDYYVFHPQDVHGMKIIVDTGHPPGEQPYQVRLRLYGYDCSYELAYSDDALAPRTTIIYEFPWGPIFKVLVEGYDGDDVCDYTLTVEAIDIEPAGDTCDEARSLPHGEFSIVSTTQGLSDDYLTWSYGGGAPDAVFGFVLGPGERFSCVFEETSTWFVRYVVDDCGPVVLDPDVVDVWSMELVYRNREDEPRRYYLIVDGIGLDMEGGFVLTGFNEGSGIVSGEAWNWGRVKSVFR